MTLTLSIFRHAKAVGKDLGIPDFDRSLTSKGIADARKVGEAIRRLRLRFDLILASPAARAMETLEAAGLSEAPGSIVMREVNLYTAGADDLLERIRQLGADVRSCLISGHNPALDELVRKLLCEPDRAKFMKSGELPKGALIELQFNADNWIDAGPATGAMMHYLIPRDLD